MDKAIAATMLLAGIGLLWLAGQVWHGKHERRGNGEQAQKVWKEGVVLLVTLAGFGIGGGLSVLFGLHFLNIEVGFVPVWLIIGFVLGAWALVDLVMRHHWSRTPVLVFLAAALIAVPAAPAAIGKFTSGHQVPSLTSVTRHHGG